MNREQLFRSGFRQGVALMLLWLLPLALSAQQRQRFSVASFEADPFDLTAREGASAQIDDNGALYAIIKVTSNPLEDDLTAYRFNFGNLYHKVVDRDGELWVYVQQNAKQVTIEREGYTPVRRYSLGSGIEAGKVYVMQLAATVAPVYKQIVQFTIQPVGANAMVMITPQKAGATEEVLGTTDATGNVAKSLPLGSYTYRIMAENYKPVDGRFTLSDRSKTHIEKVSLRSSFSSVTLRVDADADIFVDDERVGNRSWTGTLAHGGHQVECRMERHRSSAQYINVSDEGQKTFDLTPPTPIAGDLSVISTPLGANVFIDGRSYGQTPRTVNDLLIGQHSLQLSLDQYKPLSQTFEIREGETTELSLSLEAKPVKVRKPESPYQKSTCGYVQPALQVGTLMGVGIHAGAYISKVNVEAFATLGLGSETAYLNYEDADPQEQKLKARLFGARLGYGIPVGKRMRITPQVGVAALSVSSDQLKGSALCATVGARVEYAFTSFMGASLTPEAQLAVSKKDVFVQLADLSSRVKAWGTGFNARLGLYFYF